MTSATLIAQAILDELGYIVSELTGKVEVGGVACHGLASWGITQPCRVIGFATLEEAKKQHEFIDSRWPGEFYFGIFGGRLVKLTTD